MTGRAFQFGRERGGHLWDHVASDFHDQPPEEVIKMLPWRSPQNCWISLRHELTKAPAYPENLGSKLGTRKDLDRNNLDERVQNTAIRWATSL
jgi:hypothetical protein